MQLLDTDIQPLGMGCWPIGGPMFSGDQSLGYTNADDAESIRTIHAAIGAGISIFDTATAYGAGHSERLLARALKDRPDALVVTKIGIGIDEDSKQLTFDGFGPDKVAQAIEGCLSRLDRDRIDVLLLHQNSYSVGQAEPIFDAMEQACVAGKVRAYGWSTDFSESAAALAPRQNFAVVEHAMNLFYDAPRIQTVAAEHGLTALIRSPLAMGLLTGKYDAKESVPSNDVRASKETWMEYFKDGRGNPEYLGKLDAVRDLLMSDGRTLVQGAICWLWGKNPNNVPVPGARTIGQIEGIAGALSFGVLPKNVMDEIETLIERDPEDSPERER